MLAYKIIVGTLFVINIITLTLKTAQAYHYGQRRLSVINAIGVVIAAAMSIWTVLL